MRVKVRQGRQPEIGIGRDTERPRAITIAGQQPPTAPLAPLRSSVGPLRVPISGRNMGLSSQRFTLTNGLLCMLAVLVARKSYIAISVTNHVKANSPQVSQETILASDSFKKLVADLRSRDKPAALLLLNQYALNMTYNFLCNTAEFDNVHDRLVFITLDATARDELRKRWPNVVQFYWPTPCLAKSFNFASSLYQTIYLLRANLAALLARRGISFWMMQQDTFWRDNLFNHDLDRSDSPYDIMFDQLGGDHPNSLRAEWINGANFFVKASERTAEFFNATAKILEVHYTPDVGAMTMQCHTWGPERINCSYMPHRIANCWEWLFTDQSSPPTIMQMDAETDAGGKLNELAKLGFYFLNEDRKTCNSSAVSLAQHRMSTRQIQVTRKSMSWGRAQFIFYYHINDSLLSLPIVGALIKPYMMLVGFVGMLTL